ncbi:MAG: NAD(+) diphosphatase [Mogibacterium sp.]|nr:NAD(+) diphosphatase [Mogibacterium sp.]
MIQDIFPHKLHNEFEPEAELTPGSLILQIDGNKALVKMSGSSPVLPTARDLGVTDGIFLLRLDDRACFMPADKADPGEGYEYVGMRELRKVIPKEQAFTALTGFQLVNWYANNRYCGRCAGRMDFSATERALVCPNCGNTVYPKIVPAVIVAVTNGDRILLTRYANRPYSNYALIAGFTEIGETLEETVAREVMEEVGLKVKNIRYYKSQPWGIVDDILVGYYCEVDGDDTIRLDRNELKEGVWLCRDEIPGSYEDNSMTNEMIMLFRDGRI